VYGRVLLATSSTRIRTLMSRVTWHCVTRRATGARPEGQEAGGPTFLRSTSHSMSLPKWMSMGSSLSPLGRDSPSASRVTTIPGEGAGGTRELR